MSFEYVTSLEAIIIQYFLREHFLLVVIRKLHVITDLLVPLRTKHIYVDYCCLLVSLTF